MELVKWLQRLLMSVTHLGPAEVLHQHYL